MDREVRERDGVAILELNGRLVDGGADRELREAVEELVDSGRVRILLDLRGLTSIDSCGLGELVASGRRVREAGGSAPRPLPAGAGAARARPDTRAAALRVVRDRGRRDREFPSRRPEIRRSLKPVGAPDEARPRRVTEPAAAGRARAGAGSAGSRGAGVIPVSEALRIVLERTPEAPPEEVPISRAAGRVLRETVRADRDFPPFDRAAVDGYAVRAADLASGEARLRVSGLSRAGRSPRFVVRPGRAGAVMTGAPMPERRGRGDPGGAHRGGRRLRFLAASRPGGGGRRAARRGKPDHPPGRGGPRPGACSSLPAPASPPPERACWPLSAAPGSRWGGARARPSSPPGTNWRTPRARRIGPARIRDANSWLLAARCRACGLETRRLGIVRDRPEALASAIRRGLEAEMLFLSGGVSAGRFDHVEEVLAAAGVRLLITAVAIRPGKPFVFGAAEPPGRTLVFALPGNPASALTTFEVFAAPAIRRFEGLSAPAPAPVRASLGGALPAAGPRRAYLPARLTAEPDGSLRAFPIRSRGSGDLSALALANGLVILPEGRDPARPGEEVSVLPLDAGPDPVGEGGGWHDPRE